MKREKLLTITVVSLLVLNFGLLGFLFLGKGHHPPPDGGGPPHVDKIIIKTLGYNEQQQQQFDKLKHEHHEQMVKLDEQYKDVLLSYFDLLQTDTYSAQQKDSLETTLSQIQNKKASITFDHFKQLKELCTPEQKAKFNALIPELMPIILPPKHSPPPPQP